METQTTAPLGLPIRYTRYDARSGNGGVPVLLLHSFASTGGLDWPPSGLPARLSAAGRPVYVPDLPGHGRSEGLGVSATTTQLVDALAQLIEEMPGDAVDLVGYSLGARLAWSLSLACPRPINHLVLGGLSPVEPFAQLDLEQLQCLAEDGTAPGDPLTAMIGGMITAPNQNARALINLIRALKAEPFRPDAGTPQVPTVFIKGSADVLSDGIEALVAAVPEAGLVTVPGDHMRALTGAAFENAVSDFLAG